MAVTPYLNLYLPDENDYVSNERDLNDNYVKIDSAIAKLSDRNVLDAPERTVLGDALLVDNPSVKDGWNRPWRVSASGGTLYLPSDCAWGIREVLPSEEGYLQVRITGCTTNGKSAIWTNCLNNGTWSGWDSTHGVRTVLQFTVASGFTATINDVIKTGRICIIQVNGLTTNTSRSGWYQVGTLPNSATPSGRILGTFVCDNSLSSGKAPIAEVRVNTDGTIEIYSPQAGEKYWGGFTYICNYV